MAESLPNPTFLRQDQINAVGGTEQAKLRSVVLTLQNSTGHLIKQKCMWLLIEIVPVNE